MIKGREILGDPIILDHRLKIYFTGILIYFYHFKRRRFRHVCGNRAEDTLHDALIKTSFTLSIEFFIHLSLTIIITLVDVCAILFQSFIHKIN